MADPYRSAPPLDLRVFCDLAADPALDAAAYVATLRRTGRAIRCIPIRGLVQNAVFRASAWAPLERLFWGHIPERFANIVIAPMGMVLGGRRTVAELGQGLPEGRELADRNEVVVEAETALGRLWTANVVNVAITSLPDTVGTAAAADLELLKKYDAVVVATEEEFLRLAGEQLARREPWPEPGGARAWLYRIGPEYPAECWDTLLGALEPR